MDSVCFGPRSEQMSSVFLNAGLHNRVIPYRRLNAAPLGAALVLWPSYELTWPLLTWTVTATWAALLPAYEPSGNALPPALRPQAASVKVAVATSANADM